MFSAVGRSGDNVAGSDLVPGLQASYAETLELEEAYPDTNYVFVEYFLGMKQEGNDEYDDNWYSREFVQSEMGNWLETIEAMSSDLSVKQALYSKQSQATRFTDDIEYEEMVSLHATNNWSTDSPEYRCGISEIFLKHGTEVCGGVVNTGNVMLSPDWDSCKQLDRVNHL